VSDEAPRKKKKPAAPKPRDPAEALKTLKQPEVRWRIVAIVVVALLVVWGIATGLVGWIGPWGLVVAGVLTAVVAGFGFYVWRLTRRSQQIVDILKTATDEEGRRAAIEKLSQAKDSDAMAKLARAQLMSQDNPAEAIAILESVDLKKAAGVVQDDVRANLALLYLVHGRAKEARPLADEIHLDRQPQAKAKALYAAVIAETFARTGKHDEARKLLETYPPTDPEYGEVIALLYRAQVYTYMATKNRGLARKAMEALAALDPNMVAPFLLKGTRPELKELAKQVVQSTGAVPRQKMRVLRK
jgi:tetratricopeptide (TPR) repeat protein